MKLTLSTIFLWFVVLQMQAQLSLVSNAGGYFSNNDISLSWSLGEIVTETYSGSSIIITQGFQQSNLIPTGIYTNPYRELQIELYPNPVVANLYIKLKTNNPIIEQDELTLIVISTQGKLLMRENINSQESKTDLSHLMPGFYQISISNNKYLIYTAHIIKQ